MTERRQARLAKVTAATVAIAVHGAFVALLLVPVVVRTPAKVEPAPGTVFFVSLPPRPELEAPISGSGVPFEFPRENPPSTSAASLVSPVPALAFPPEVPALSPFGAIPPLTITPDKVFGAVGRALACTYASLDALSPDQRMICEAMLREQHQQHPAPDPYAYTADLAALRAQWAEDLARKLAPPEWTSLNSLTPFCRWDQSLCWLERYTTLGLERLDFLHGASIGRTFDLGRGWSAAFGASIKSVSFTRNISLQPGRDTNTEFIAGIAVAYRW